MGKPRNFGLIKRKDESRITTVPIPSKTENRAAPLERQPFNLPYDNLFYLNLARFPVVFLRTFTQVE